MYVIFQMASVAILQSSYKRYDVFSEARHWNVWATNGICACNLYKRWYRRTNISAASLINWLHRIAYGKILLEILLHAQFIYIHMVYVTMLSIAEIKLYGP
jgi:hypothetical protein